jgi:hypothetical protein
MGRGSGEGQAATSRRGSKGKEGPDWSTAPIEEVLARGEEIVQELAGELASGDGFIPFRYWMIGATHPQTGAPQQHEPEVNLTKKPYPDDFFASWVSPHGPDRVVIVGRSFHRDVEKELDADDVPKVRVFGTGEEFAARLYPVKNGKLGAPVDASTWDLRPAQAELRYAINPELLDRFKPAIEDVANQIPRSTAKKVQGLRISVVPGPREQYETAGAAAPMQWIPERESIEDFRKRAVSELAKQVRKYMPETDELRLIDDVEIAFPMETNIGLEDGRLVEGWSVQPVVRWIED